MGSGVGSTRLLLLGCGVVVLRLGDGSGVAAGIGVLEVPGAAVGEEYVAGVGCNVPEVLAGAVAAQFEQPPLGSE